MLFLSDFGAWSRNSSQEILSDFLEKVTILLESGELRQNYLAFCARVANTRSKNDDPSEGNFRKLTEGPRKMSISTSETKPVGGDGPTRAVTVAIF